MISEIVKSFNECCDKYLCELMIDVFKISNEIHLVGFYGEILCTSDCVHIFVQNIVLDFR